MERGCGGDEVRGCGAGPGGGVARGGVAWGAWLGGGVGVERIGASSGQVGAYLG